MKRLLLLLSLCVAILGLSTPSYAYTRCYHYPYEHCVRYVTVYRPVVYERQVVYTRPYYHHWHRWHHHHWHHRHWHDDY